MLRSFHKALGGDCERYINIINGNIKPDNRTAEEIIEDVCERAGIKIV